MPLDSRRGQAEGKVWNAHALKILSIRRITEAIDNVFAAEESLVRPMALQLFDARGRRAERKLLGRKRGGAEGGGRSNSRHTCHRRQDG